MLEVWSISLIIIFLAWNIVAHSCREAWRQFVHSNFSTKAQTNLLNLVQQISHKSWDLYYLVSFGHICTPTSLVRFSASLLYIGSKKFSSAVGASLLSPANHLCAYSSYISGVRVTFRAPRLVQRDQFHRPLAEIPISLYIQVLTVVLCLCGFSSCWQGKFYVYSIMGREGLVRVELLTW